MALEDHHYLVIASGRITGDDDAVAEDAVVHPVSGGKGNLWPHWPTVAAPKRRRCWGLNHIFLPNIARAALDTDQMRRYVAQNAPKIEALAKLIAAGDKSTFTDYEAVVGPVPTE